VSILPEVVRLETRTRRQGVLIARTLDHSKERPMAQFMLLLHESPADFSSFSPEEIQRVIGEYTAWRLRLQEEGKLAGGLKLADEGGRELSLENDRVRVVDGPYAEAKEVLGGYFLIEAADYDEAVEISKGCPHLEYGSRIVLREVDPLQE